MHKDQRQTQDDVEQRHEGHQPRRDIADSLDSAEKNDPQQQRDDDPDREIDAGNPGAADNVKVEQGRIYCRGDRELLENPVLESEKADDDRVIDIDALRDKIIENNYDLESYKQWEGASSPEDDYSFEQYVAFRYSLVEHLLIQLQFSGLGEDDAKIGRYIIEGINDNGYLTMSADEIAKTMRCDADTVERVLDVIQTFEPTGVGAYSDRKSVV